MKKALKDMHEAVVATFLALYSKEDAYIRGLAADRFQREADDIRREHPHFVEGDMKTLRGSPIGLKVAALEDVARRLREG